MAYDKKQFLNMLAAGLCSKGRTGKQLPTTYIAASQIEPNNQDGAQKMFYNGTLLPGLPEWDKEKYPYAYICKIWNDGNRIAHLFVTAEPMAVVDALNSSGFEGYISSCGKEVACKKYECNIAEGTKWDDGYQTSFYSQTTYKPFWANTDMEKYLQDSGETSSVLDDVYTPTGEIGFTKSEPVPAFSYNGTVLPKLPEWDKSKYPYAALFEHKNYEGTGLAQYWMYFCANKFTVSALYTHYTAPCAEYGNFGDVWELYLERTNNEGYQLAYNFPIWSNHDILHNDGSIYLAASDPIPVYE